MFILFSYLIKKKVAMTLINTLKFDNYKKKIKIAHKILAIRHSR